MASAGGVSSVRGESPFEMEVFCFESHTLHCRNGSWWSREYPLTETAKVVEVDENTAVDVYRWLREVCSTKLLQTPIVLVGLGIVVQIDESQLCHKPKVTH